MMKRLLCFLLVFMLIPAFACSSQVSKDTVLSVIQTLLSENFDYVNVTETDGIIDIRFCMNGVAAAVSLAKQNGFDENYEGWVAVKNSIHEIYNSALEVLESFGYENQLISIYLLNDIAKDNVLFIYAFGLDFYDVLAKENLSDIFE